MSHFPKTLCTTGDSRLEWVLIFTDKVYNSVLLRKIKYVNGFVFRVKEGKMSLYVKLLSPYMWFSRPSMFGGYN